MKKLLPIIISIVLVASTATFMYYLLVLVPKMNADKLDLLKQKQTAEIESQREKDKQSCLALKYSSDKDASNPLLAGYRKSTLEC